MAKETCAITSPNQFSTYTDETTTIQRRWYARYKRNENTVNAADVCVYAYVYVCECVLCCVVLCCAVQLADALVLMINAHKQKYRKRLCLIHFVLIFVRFLLCYVYAIVYTHIYACRIRLLFLRQQRRRQQ